MLRGALRLAVGTVSLATGGWVLRALHGTPAALGAQPSEIRGVAERSPHYHDGVFVNLEPASLNIDTEEQRNILWELISGRAAGRPATDIPLITPEPRAFEAVHGIAIPGRHATHITTVLYAIPGALLAMAATYWIGTTREHPATLN